MPGTDAFWALGGQALLPIVLGSFKSLRTPTKLKKKRRAAKRRSGKLVVDDSEDEDEEEELDEVLTMADSILFPILGSAALLGLWFVIKYVDKKWIDLVFGLYFSAAGMFAVHTTLTSVFGGVLAILGATGPLYHIRISSGIKQIFHLPIRRASMLALPIALALPAAYVPLGRPYALSNFLALCLATAALSLLRLDGFPTATALLGLLLIYDIFWVFYTPVMVTVAKGIDAPIKLMAPKDSSGGFAMLGLGDVVVPGLMIALCLRFDMGRAALKRPNEDISPRSSFSRTYFYAALVSYVIGLTVTVYVMQWSGRAQPALLYLSPACIIGPSLLAAAKGELGLLWNWREDSDEEERDVTIEAPSEIAQQARKEAKEKAQEEVEEVEVAEPEDDSWMENSGTPSETKARKRRGKKK